MKQVSFDTALACEEIVDLVGIVVDWDELGHWLAVLRDYDSLVLGQGGQARPIEMN